MMVNQDMDAASQDVRNLESHVDDKSHPASISPSDKIVNNEINVDSSISETMPMVSDKVTETETTNQVLQDQGDPLFKLTDDDENILVKPEVPSSKLEDEKEIKVGDKTELVEMSASSPLEQVDNPLESCAKTDDKDQDLVDNNDIQQTESPKTSTNSEIVKDGVKDAENANDNGSHLFKLSVNSKTSDMELDSGTMDPLEVARQVAMEVERDVDSRERSCSTTSDKTSDSKNGHKIQCKPNGQESQSQPPLVKDAETLVSQVSEVAQESEPDTVKGFSGFDLNQEVCSEEVDNPVNPVSSTVSVVSASQPSAASGLSSTPLQFEGILGLKESISTSALKPIPDGTRNNSKQRLDCLDFDLNAADGCEDKTLPSGEESSVEANPRGPTKMQLDLNSILDEGCDGHVTSINQTRWQSPSRSSSSSSKQPSLKNIDLNLIDQPESVIRLFGSKVGVKKNDHPAQPSVSNLGPTQYGHNGFASEAAMFFPTPMYGAHGMPIPYMVDLRGSPIVPQIMGSSLAPPIAFPQQASPFLMNMAAAGSSGVGPSYLNFDLNTGLVINGGNRETNSGLRQFLPQNGNEQYLSTSSPSGSIVGGKRHVPDSGWDFFPASKHQQPPWR
ncbi:hypothetical protein CTI12_AA524650 [Artemisia annua]|uniref:Uncharacterized protein n=1 Tax=Artemisia annua TaxID=35608 RepID=A0A2U1L6Q5_ARTAN|nr:hypothetical protein CTI12_AA524650 [Artemisia annua]